MNNFKHTSVEMSDTLNIMINQGFYLTPDNSYIFGQNMTYDTFLNSSRKNLYNDVKIILKIFFLNFRVVFQDVWQLTWKRFFASLYLIGSTSFSSFQRGMKRLNAITTFQNILLFQKADIYFETDFNWLFQFDFICFWRSTVKHLRNHVVVFECNFSLFQISTNYFFA